MDFTNATPWPATFLAGSTGEREMLGIAVCKATWRAVDGRLEPAPAADHWPVFDKPFAIGPLVLGVEIEHRKRGVDLLVIGDAHAPGGKPVERLEVGLSCGGINHRTLVFGDRHWERSWGRFRASSPQPFTTMPLTNDRAFGGVAQHDGQPMPHAVNSIGRGYHAAKDHAEGQPLPNLELPGQEIAAWSDLPTPACWYKPTGISDFGSGTTDEIGARLLERSFNQTIPALIAEDGKLGEQARLTGFSPDGELTLPMPPTAGPVGIVSLGAERSRIPSRLSTVVLIPGARAVVATYLCLFRYLMKPRDLRAVELRWDA